MESPTAPKPTFDDEEIRLLLAGSDIEVRKGMALLNERVQRIGAAWVKQRCPWLQSSDLPIIWAKALEELYAKVSQDKVSNTFDLDRPILPFLCTILQRRAIDTLRQRESEQKRHEVIEEHLQAVGKALQSTQTGRKWKSTSEGERKELRHAILQAIASLPERQRLVCGVHFAHRGELSVQQLADKVALQTGTPETVAKIKGSLQAGRKKIRDLLERRGFPCGGSEE